MPAALTSTPAIAAPKLRRPSPRKPPTEEQRTPATAHTDRLEQASRITGTVPEQHHDVLLLREGCTITITYDSTNADEHFACGDLKR